MKRDKIFIEQDLFRFDLIELLIKVFFVDEPRAAVVREHFLGYKLLIFFERVDDMLEKFPAETKRG